MPTLIPYADETWEVVTGCSPCGTGCMNCYAAKLAGTRLKHHRHYKGLTGSGQWTGKVRCNHDLLDQPLHWRKPRRIFVASRGDLFHPDVPWEFQRSVFGVMHSAQQHQFLVLTKRPENMRQFIEQYTNRYGYAPKTWMYEYQHIALGVSCSTQEDLDENVPLLLSTPAISHWLSLEPLLGPVDVLPRLGVNRCWEESDGQRCSKRLGHQGVHCAATAPGGWGRDKFTFARIDWVVVGCESGPKRRPCHSTWIEKIVNQCDEAVVPVFVKQLDLDGRANTNPGDWSAWARRRELLEFGE